MSTILVKIRFRQDCLKLEEYFKRIQPIIGRNAYEKAVLIQRLLGHSNDNIVNYYETMQRLCKAADLLKLIVKATSQSSDDSAEVLFILTRISANCLQVMSDIDIIVEKRCEEDHDKRLIAWLRSQPY